MERIAPLAKILAEANGIEWEHLQGTGPSGQIVEQDILDYLTRVMSGEAEPPSTPVDAPPPDWDGNDLPGAGMFDAAALSKAGVESDIAEFVSQGRPAGDAQIHGVQATELETSDFELEEEADPVTTPPPVAQPPAPIIETPRVQTAPTPAPAAAATTAASGLGSLLSRLYHKDDVAPAPLSEPAPAPQHVPQVVPQVVEVPTVDMPHLEAAPVVEPPAPVTPAPFTEPELAPAPEVVKIPEPQPVHVEVTPSPAVEVPAPVVQAAAVFMDEEAPAAAIPATPAPASAVASAPTSNPPVSNAPLYRGPTSEVPRDAVWFGTYLRRSANVGQLNDLRGQLSEALERDVPLALLVARAAQRHMDALGLANVAMQDINAGKALSVGAGSSSGIRDAVTASASEYDGTPDLLIVDAGQIGLDDLHYPHALTLSVSRVEDGKASLSLQGDVEAAKAAVFLSKVADTLEKPVILLV